MIIIFSYNRLDMLYNLFNQFKTQHLHIIDDGSDFDKTDFRYKEIASFRGFHKLQHTGKEGFYKKWNFALKLCEKSNSNFFMFIPDDFQNIQYDTIKKRAARLHGQYYFYNIINDGRVRCWTQITSQKIDDMKEKVGFVDCAFFTNRISLEKLGFYMNPIPQSYFNRPGILSSGVGRQLSIRINRKKIPIYRPCISFAYHGDHDSVMHPEERKRNPLISK